ncbi:MAG: CDP-glycerol glycerophosphotransferase family protein [Prevotella sp.]|nr:CDP-glycerol glycerophosphotransferase family protein [Prevotella sp.]
MKINFASHRKKSLPANALLFNFSRLWYKRDSQLWVYGTHEGTKYDDNARYLFEYVNREHGQEIRSVWLAANEEVVDTVKKAGGEAYTFNSKEGKQVARHAGVAIFTNGLDDFGPWPKVGGAKLVFLGHGVGFKKTYNAKYSGKALFIKKAMDKVFSWIHRDLTIATSEYNKHQRMMNASLRDGKAVAITGQPRNDILKNKGIREDIFSRLGIEPDKRLILYLPTYRGNALGLDAMKNIVLSLYENKTLQETLDKTNSVFIAKLHPLTPPVELPDRDNFRVMHYQEVESNQELLAAGDVLITDFSSCCVDFALLDRPVIFYLPDKEEFVNHSEPVCDEFYDICSKCECITPESLADMLTHESLAATDAINQLYEDPSIKGTCYSENVYRAIINQFNK